MNCLFKIGFCLLAGWVFNPPVLITIFVLMCYSQEKSPDTLTQPKSNILLLSINNFSVNYKQHFSYCSTYNISTISQSWSVLANADVSDGFYPTLIKMM